MRDRGPTLEPLNPRTPCTVESFCQGTFALNFFRSFLTAVVKTDSKAFSCCSGKLGRQPEPRNTQPRPREARADLDVDDLAGAGSL